MTTLISATELLQSADFASHCILDCRHDLTDPLAGASAFADGHIAGARHVHLDHDLAGPRNGQNGRHPLPDRSVLAEVFARWGVAENTKIVAYDAHGGSFAARLWWLSRWLGHQRVVVLDGGWDAWLAAGGARSTQNPPLPQRTPFVARESAMSSVDAPAVLAALSDASRLIVDARAPARYSGAEETIDPVGGHIPGAVNRFWQRNLDTDGRFKSPAALRAEFNELLQGRPATSAIMQCGSGVTACHHVLAMELAGLSGAALYSGSWSEWVADPSRPVAQGADPGRP